jgi:hypothetical protein
LIDKIRDVGFCESVSRLDRASPDIDVIQLAVIDETHDLISRRFEARGGFF